MKNIRKLNQEHDKIFEKELIKRKEKEKHKEDESGLMTFML